MKYINYRLFYISKVLAQYKWSFLHSLEQTLWEGKKRESEAYCCLELYEVKVKITALSTMKKNPSNQTSQTNQSSKKKTQNHPNKTKTTEIKTRKKPNPKTKQTHTSNIKKIYPQSNYLKSETKFCTKYTSTLSLVFWIENGYLLN